MITGETIVEEIPSSSEVLDVSMRPRRDYRGNCMSGSSVFKLSSMFQ